MNYSRAETSGVVVRQRRLTSNPIPEASTFGSQLFSVEFEQRRGERWFSKVASRSRNWGPLLIGKVVLLRAGFYPPDGKL
jgi:hypothetical protein